MTIYPINSRAIVFITHFSRIGLFGKIDDRTRGIIRTREISWDTDTHLHLESYVNKSFPAIVIGFDVFRDQVELSLRLVERDPWKDAEKKYAPGREVEGIVVGLIEDAAFMELEPGIEAFLPLAEVPSTTPHRIEELLWINDHVKAMVVELVPYQRKLRLSIRDLIAQRERGFNRQMWSSQFHESSSGVTIAEYLPKDTRLRLLRMSAEEKDSASAVELHVLIIEDDEIFASGLSNLLQANGCKVILAKDSISGLDYIDNRDFDFHLIILDWNLPTLKGHQILRQLRDANIQSRMVTILDSSYLKDFPDIWDSILECDTDILSKSDNDSLTIGILSVLRELRQGKTQRTAERRRQVPRPEISISHENPPASINESSPIVKNYQGRLSSILGGLQSATHASTIAILCLDSAQPMPRVEMCLGKPLLLTEASPDILYSPLGDVLQKQQEVYLDVKPNSARFKRLLALLEFHGFIGAPIPVLDTTTYGLILLKERRGFDQSALHQARSNAYLLGSILAERRFLEIFQPWQAQNLIGQLSSNIIHEVNNKLSGIELQVQRLKEGIQEITRWPERAEDAMVLRKLDEAVEGISKAQKAASELRNWYLGTTAADTSQDVDLFKLALGMKRALHSQAQEKNIIILLEAQEHLPMMKARPSQLQQIFLNLMLNAIQMMAGIDRSGRLMIQIEYDNEATLPFKVRFRDEGPGIHEKLTDRIFEFGFTTKKRGAGLGLTISRQLAEACQGRLTVESSHVLWGTTFLLELPKG